MRATFTGGAAPVMLDPTPAIRQAIAHAQAAIGDMDAAIKTVSETGQAPFAAFARKELVDKIVDLRLDAGDIAGARRAADLITPVEVMFQDDKANLLEKIARRQARQGDPAPVLDWALKQAMPRAKLQVLRGLADGIAERFDPKVKASKPAGP